MGPALTPVCQSELNHRTLAGVTKNCLLCRGGTHTTDVKSEVVCVWLQCENKGKQ